MNTMTTAERTSELPQQQQLDFGALLQLSQFLTSFQSLHSFVGDDEDQEEKENAPFPQQVGPFNSITPADIESVLKFRDALRRLADLEEEAFLYKFHNKLEDGAMLPEHDENNPYFQSLKAAKANIRFLQGMDCIDDDKSVSGMQEERGTSKVRDLHQLLECFAVWWTKSLVQDVLLPHGHEGTAEASIYDNPFCWSKLLNLPSAYYMSSILPAIEEQKQPQNARKENGETNRTTSATATAAPPQKKKRTIFAEIFHKVYNNCNTDSSSQSFDRSCSICLPPTVFTQKEYLRLAYMVALLPNREARTAAHKSLLCATAASMKNACKVPFKLNQADLVALWVRAQRNTQAMRHLVNLFSILVDDGMEDSTSEQAEAQPSSRQRYRAVYKGNHRLVQRRVINESPLVDSLVEWAVINQVLFTQQHILSAFKEPPLIPARPRRRQRRRQHQQYSNIIASTNGQHGIKKNKRVRLTNEDASTSDAVQIELMRACRMCILRRFARRNRNIASIIFYSKVDYFLPAKKYSYPLIAAEGAGGIANTAAAKLAQIMETIKSKASKEKTSDITLCRIDRRLGAGKYDEDIYNDYEESGGAIVRDLFHDRVVLLLQALRESLSEQPDLICSAEDGVALCEAALEDFEKLYVGWFLEMKNTCGVVQSARALVDAPLGTAPEELKELLYSTPAPWVGHCSICENTVLKNTLLNNGISRSFRVCACCEAAVHISCDDSPGWDDLYIKNLIQNYPPLAEMYKSRVPTDVLPPDFRGSVRSSQITWTTKTVVVERHRYNDGSLQRYGLSLVSTEDCANHLEQLLTGTRLVSEAQTFDLPLRIDEKIIGCIVKDATEGDKFCGHSSGVLVGDVIVGLEHLNYDDSLAEGKVAKTRIHTFSKIPFNQRVQLFNVGATKIRLIIKRPSIDLIRESLCWVENINKKNEVLLASLDRNTSIWVCRKCRTDSGSFVEEGRSRVRREAQHGKAVIRRLSMESYSIPYNDENHISSEAFSQSLDAQERVKLHGICASLWRLDRMMDWIILENSEDRHQTTSEKQSYLAAFYVAGEPLEWAKNFENKPLELLCRGMELIARSSSTRLEHSQPAMNDDIQSLLADFLRLFCAWCVAPKLSPHLEVVSTSGPPRHALFARDPWQKPCCQFCLVRPLDESSPYDYCSFCAAFAVAEPREDLFVRSYEKCSSLVGATVLMLPGEDDLNYASAALGKAGVRLEHFDRPVEFIVASYLPSRLDGAESTPVEQLLGGTFYLLPVAAQPQLQYLLSRCQLRQTPSRPSEKNFDEWKVDGLLNLEGIVHYNYSQLRRKLSATASIYEAISSEVARRAQCVCGNSPLTSPSTGDYSCSSSTNIPCQCLSVDSKLAHCLNRVGLTSMNDAVLCDLALIDGVMRSGNPIFLEVVESYVDSDSAAVSRSNLGTNGVFDEYLPAERFHKDIESEPGQRYITKLPLGDEICELLYTDLCFLSEQDMLLFTQKNNLCRPLVLNSGTAKNFHKKSLTIVLSMAQSILVEEESNTHSYESECGIGWGFELIKWRDEGMVRVGRIHSNSPAIRAGLCSGDIVVHINGKHPLEIGSTASIACAILSKSFCIRSTEPALTAAEVLTRQRRGLQEQTVGPVVLHIIRLFPRKSVPRNATNLPRQQVRQSSACDSETLFAEIPRDHAQRTQEKSRTFPNKKPLTVALSKRPDGGVSQPRAINTFQRSSSFDEGVSQNNPVIYRAIEHGNLFRRISSIKFGERMLSRRDLYDNLPRSNLVLTLAETSLLLEAIRQGHPMLGIRMLCPRYTIDAIFQQLEFLCCQSHTSICGGIPRLPQPFFNKMLQFDYERSKKEPPQNPSIFVDHKHDYRMPLQRLPIDRIFEQMLTLTQQVRSHSTAVTAFSQTNGVIGSENGAGHVPETVDLTRDDDLDAERIRGGGPQSTFRADHVQRLNEVPKSLWNLSLVASKCRVDLKGNSNSVTHFLGYVRWNPSFNTMQDSEGVVSVSVFYLANLGILVDPIDLQVDANKLTIPGANSKEAAIAAEFQSREASLLEQNTEKNTFLEKQNPLLKSSATGDPIVTDSIQTVDQVHLQNNGDQQEVHNQRDADKQKTSLLGGMTENFVPAENLYFPLQMLVTDDQGNARPAQKQSRSSLLGRKGDRRTSHNGNLDYVDLSDDLSKEVVDVTGAGSTQAVASQTVGHTTLERNDQHLLHEHKRDGLTGMKKDTFELSSKLDMEQRSSVSLIGVLPDGREVYWFQGDPSALYLTTVDFSCHLFSREYYRNEDIYLKDVEKTGCLSTSDGPGKHFCVWGCSTKGPTDNRQCLAFDSMKELATHLKLCHSFCLSEKKIRLGTAAMKRLGGDEIGDLISSITAAACARSSFLIEITKNGRSSEKTDASGRMFSSSPIARSIYFQASLVEGETATAINRVPERVLRLLELSRRILRLFTASGQSLYQPPATVIPGTSTSRGYMEGTLEHKMSADCCVCNLGAERELLRRDIHIDESQQLYNGIGCSPVGDLYFGKAKQETSSNYGICGGLAALKRLLISLTKRIPMTSRVGDQNILDSAKGANASIGGHLWSGNHLELWRNFVVGSRSISSLAQAFVILVASVDRDKLPRWWSSEGSEWSTAQIIMKEQPKSTLFFHIYVFDLALAESISSAAIDPPSSILSLGGKSHLNDELKGMAYDDRVGKVLDWASQLGHRRHQVSRDGEHYYNCYICHDGGDLLCCELCRNVCHQDCIKPAIVSEPRYFLCESCMVDVCTLRRFTKHTL